MTVTAKEGCGGRVNTRFVTTPSAFVLVLTRPGPNVCDTISGKPALPNRTLVKITTVPNNSPCGGIYYSNMTPNCFDADGGPDVATATAGPTNFPFLGRRKFSLVLRVGTQVEQGGTNMSFTTTQTAPLELCVNTSGRTSWDRRLRRRSDEPGAQRSL